MDKHTPGEWWTPDFGSDEPFTDVAYLKREPEQAFAEVEANARLITAAPRLLDVARATRTQVGSMLTAPSYQDRMSPMVRATYEKLVEMAEEAIALAEGPNG